MLHCMSKHATLEVVAMGPHMTIQVATLGETCITDLALVGFFASMGAIMLGKGGTISESFATGTALVGAVS